MDKEYKKELIEKINRYLILLDKETKNDTKNIYSELLLMKSFLMMPEHFKEIIQKDANFSLEENFLIEKINNLLDKLNKIFD